mmetsp:Transcript_27497/g.49519  ORF Transcript_27497/g.49519 Transcript_27497/m.49519 type:complete len:302 (+) Transcript_27497:233-1138(+)
MNLLASVPEELRVAQKDQQHSAAFSASFFRSVESWCERRTYLGSALELSTVASAIYYIANYFPVLNGFVPQCPGEEYVNATLVGKELPTQYKQVLGSENYPIAAKAFSPGMPRRLLYVLIKVGLPYVVKKASAAAARRAANREEKRFWDFMPNLEEMFNLFDKAHFGWFLVEGFYDELAKRLCGLVHVRLQRTRNANIVMSRVGWVILAQASLTLVGALLKAKADYTRHIEAELTSSSDSDTAPDTSRCSLCLSQRRVSACTPCGHIFCWNCILAALQVKQSCPECRAACSPQSVLQLRNL